MCKAGTDQTTEGSGGSNGRDDRDIYDTIQYRILVLRTSWQRGMGGYTSQ